MSSPTIRLEELRRRLQSSQEIVLGPDGVGRTPDDPAVKNLPPSEKATIKPTRWFV